VVYGVSQHHEKVAVEVPNLQSHRPLFSLEYLVKLDAVKLKDY
jgi:hypothetical protein